MNFYGPLQIAPDDILSIDENTLYVTDVYYYRMSQSIWIPNIEIIIKRPCANIILRLKAQTIGKGHWFDYYGQWYNSFIRVQNYLYWD